MTNGMAKRGHLGVPFELRLICERLKSAISGIFAALPWLSACEVSTIKLDILGVPIEAAT